MKKYLNKILKNERGAVAIIFGLVLPILLLLLALSIDVSKTYAVRAKLASANDAAILAAATVPEQYKYKAFTPCSIGDNCPPTGNGILSPRTETQVQRANPTGDIGSYADKYRVLNLAGNYLGADTHVAFDENNSGIITGNGSATQVKTFFQSNTTLAGGSEAKVQRAGVVESTTPTLIGFVLDDSKSMAGKRRTALKNALACFLATVSGAKDCNNISPTGNLPPKYEVSFALFNNDSGWKNNGDPTPTDFLQNNPPIPVPTPTSKVDGAHFSHDYATLFNFYQELAPTQQYSCISCGLFAISDFFQLKDVWPGNLYGGTAGVNVKQKDAYKRVIVIVTDGIDLNLTDDQIRTKINTNPGGPLTKTLYGNTVYRTDSDEMEKLITPDASLKGTFFYSDWQATQKSGESAFEYAINYGYGQAYENNRSNHPNNPDFPASNAANAWGSYTDTVGKSIVGMPDPKYMGRGVLTMRNTCKILRDAGYEIIAIQYATAAKQRDNWTGQALRECASGRTDMVSRDDIFDPDSGKTESDIVYYYAPDDASLGPIFQTIAEKHGGGMRLIK